MKTFWTVLVFLCLGSCAQPNFDASAGAGEIYVVNSTKAFSGFVEPDDGGPIPRFCPIDSEGFVAACSTPLPAPGASSRAVVEVDGQRFTVHRMSLSSSGRYAFVRTSTLRSTGARRGSLIVANTGTTVIDATPNSVHIFPLSKVDPEAYHAAIAEGLRGHFAAADARVPVSEAQNLAVARSAVEGVYPGAAAGLTYRVSETWEVKRRSGGSFQLSEKLLP